MEGCSLSKAPFINISFEGEIQKYQKSASLRQAEYSEMGQVWTDSHGRSTTRAVDFRVLFTSLQGRDMLLGDRNLYYKRACGQARIQVRTAIEQVMLGSHGNTDPTGFRKPHHIHGLPSNK